MRWFWQRRRQRQAAVESPVPVPSPTTTATVHRAPTTSGRLGQPRQLSGELLLLAREYLQAIGGRVRVEDEDVLSATLPDGKLVRYTSTVAKARADASMTLLVEGSEALADMLDDIAARSRITALRLPPGSEPVALALARLTSPAPTCGRCLEAPRTRDESHPARCALCPLREGRVVLRWRASGSLSARLVGQEQHVSVELAYLVMARDRQGRRDEWLRRAVDVATGETFPPLTESALAAAQPDALPADSERMLAAARAKAERTLSGPLVATGIFLRQRSLDEYRRRLDEVATTFDRLQRESPESARAAKAGRGREIAALSDVYAVDVEARLESACFITSPLAVVAVRPHKGRGELLVRVDLGRGHVLPPRCAACGESVEAGFVCDTGHVVCARCTVACPRCGEWPCSACGETQETACPKCKQPIQRPPAPRAVDDPAPADGTLTVRYVETLPPDMWLTAVEWLLSCQGITTESRRVTGDLALWQGQSAAGKTMVAALRSGGRWALDEGAVRQAAAHLTTDHAAAARIVFSMAPATTEAIQVARELDIQLMDQRVLDDVLARVASAHDRERERQLAEAQARADAAVTARKALLDTVDAVAHMLAPVRRVRRGGAQGGAGSTSATRALIAARSAIERASLAWETLLGDWAESFGERPARNGSLVMHGEVSHFEEMTDRAAHLRAVLLDSIKQLADTPARGEASYTTLRQAILSECEARGEAWRWRIQSYDPDAWHDFDRAWNAKAATKAAEAITAAGHATARADKAQAQVPAPGSVG